MNEFSLITLEQIIDRCLAKYFGQNDIIKSLVSDNTYNESWNGLIKWIKYELDLGRAIMIPNMGVWSIQTYKEDTIIYFRFNDAFLQQWNLYYEDMRIKEVRYPTIVLNIGNIKKFTTVDRDIMDQAIQNILLEIEHIFHTFDNFQLDLGALGKFLVENKNLRFLPFTKNKKKKQQKKMTIKNLVEMNLKKNHQFSQYSRLGPTKVDQPDSIRESDRNISEANPLGKSKDPQNQMMEQSQRSMGKSIFSQNSDFVSPIRRLVRPLEDDALLNEMYGAGTDPLALNQDYSNLAADANKLIS